jgi:two-component system, NtrC family, nitrogen regulation response regulator NtrX
MSAPRILVVDDEAEIRLLVRDILIDEGYDVEVAANASEARAVRSKREPDLVLLDIWMPDTDGITLLREWAQHGLNFIVVMMSGHGTVETAVEATRLGAFDFVEKPLSLAKLLRTVESALESAQRKRQIHRTLVPQLLGPVGRSAAAQTLRELIQRVTPHHSSICLIGEPGTGKLMLARYIHQLSPRAQQPFVVLTAANINSAKATSLLCGASHSSERGLFEQAHGGVLFIDDARLLIAEAKQLLLSALRSGFYSRENSIAPQPLNVRVIAAWSEFDSSHNSSHGDDADYREFTTHLDAVTIRIPSLRECTEDIPELLRCHAESLVDEERLPLRHFSVGAQNRLRNYPWPGNLRELRNFVRRMLILGGSEAISLAEVERELNLQANASEPLVKQDLLALPLREAREQFERAYLQQQLQLCNNSVGQLAKRVGMERTHLYRKLRTLGIDFRQSADDSET